MMPAPDADRVARARGVIAEGERTILRIGPAALATTGLGVTVATFALPGVAHIAGLCLGAVAVPVHLLASGWLLVAPARLVLRSPGRKFLVRWIGRITTLATIGWAYPLVAVPIVGVVVPPVVCAALVFGHARYLHWQIDRDGRSVPMHGLEVATLAVMAIVAGVGLMIALTFAVGMGLAIDHWGNPVLEWLRRVT